MDDRELVTRILDGDLDAFRVLISQNEKLVAHMIGRLIKHDGDREDLCQEVFIRVYEKLDEFNFQSKLSTWIATIAYRRAINHLRKRKIFVENIDDVVLQERLIAQANPEIDLSEQDMDEFMVFLIDALPTQYKTVLLLYHKDNLSYVEIEEITGMPEGTVKNYLFRARKMLKEQLLKHMGKEDIL